MVTVTTRQAVEYGLSREMLRLYGLVLLGYVALGLGSWFGANWAPRGGGAGLIGQVLGIALAVCGFVIVLGGFVGIVYKVIADANAVARD